MRDAGEATGANSISQAVGGWSELEHELARTLSHLGEGEWQYLILSDQRTSRYVQFAVHAETSLRAEAVSSDYLPKEHELGKAEEEALVGAGWVPPGIPGPAGGDAPKRPGNYHRDFERPVNYQEVAALAVRTLRDVFQTPYPGRLEYRAFERGGNGIIVPGLQLVRHRPAPSAPEPAKPLDVTAMQQRLLDAFRKVTNDPGLELDKDGDIPVRFNSAAVYVHAKAEPPFVVLFSPLVSKVEHREGIVDRLNDLNGQGRFARLFEANGTIWAAIEVFADPFVVEHVLHACWYLGELADGLDELLQAQFGGRTTFGEFRQKSLKN